MDTLLKYLIPILKLKYMPDNKKNTGTPDNKRIDINDPNELRNWAKSLNVTQADIIRSVKKVGTSAAAVRKELKK